jgi:inositol oxygenase
VGLLHISAVVLCHVTLICCSLLDRRKMKLLFFPESIVDRQTAENPLKNLDDWDDFVASRYKENRDREGFRNYDPDINPGVAEFYRQNHALQTVEFVQAKEHEYLPLKKEQKTIWQAAEFLNTLVDDSDPDTDLTQIEHLLQTSEAIRKDGHPRWFVLAGLIHDLGKVLCLYGEPQWAVVGDTFPVGCAYSDTIVFPEYFRTNPDSQNPLYQDLYGIYEPHCGLENVHMSWGHDEYIYHVAKNYLPEPALYMLRYHSFYSAHKHGAYRHLMSAHDEEMFQWVQKFNPYDLYSKGAAKPNVPELLPFYQELIAEYFPGKLQW